MHTFFILAQEQASSGWWSDLLAAFEGTTHCLGYEIPLQPLVGLPLVVLGLWLASLLARLILGRWLKALTKRSASVLDDALIRELERAVIQLFTLVAAEALVSSTALGKSAAARDALVVIAIVVIAFVGVRIVLSMTDEWIRSRPNLTPLGPPIKLGVKLLWVPLVLLTVLSAIDVEIIQFVTTLGVGSLAIALALQDTLANVFAGVQLVVDQPIRAGDFVEVEGGHRGIVFEIGLRSTKIRTLNNNMVIVPNNVLAKNVVVNNDAWDATYAHRFFIGVGYDSDSRKVERVLREVLDTAGDAVDGVLPGPHSVRFVEFGDSALMFRLEVRLDKFPGRRRPLSELHHRIHERLGAEGVDIPFPMRTVILRREGQSPLPPQGNRL